MASLELQDMEEEASDSEDLFSLSPLTSPEPTPPSSPRATQPPLPLDLPLPKTSQPTVATTAPRTSHSKRQGHANRKRKRDKAKLGPAEYTPRSQTRKKYAESAAEAGSEATGEDFPIAKTGYTAARGSNSSTAYKLDELVGPGSRFGFKLIEWDGR